MSQEKIMRAVFGETLAECGRVFPELVVCDADVSSSTQTKIFGDAFPDRFFNFGIAEGNMVAAAAGMATCGMIPVVSSFAFLLTLRAADPVYSLIAYNSLNVKVAGGYAGLSDFADGASHQAIMDLSVARALPNFTVLAPSDIESTRGAVRAMLQHKGPVYLRLSREAVGSYHGGNDNFTIGKGTVLREGSDVTLAVTGTLLPEALRAAELLEAEGISAGVTEFLTLKPFDGELLLDQAQKTRAVVSIEEHTIFGGLGSAVAEVLAENPCAVLRRVGMQDTFGESGTYPKLLEKYGLTAPSIVRAAKEAIAAKK